MNPRMRTFCLLLAALLGLVHMTRGAGVVINEIMYHPPNDQKSLEYVELHNPGSVEADLSGWSFAKGIEFRFPNGAKIPPGGYLVVCRDRTRFAAQYGGTIPTAGNFSGKLSHHKQHVELADAAGKTVDSVKYEDEAPWPAGPDGSSASLERIDPTAASELPENWAGSKLPQFEAPAGTPGRRNDNFATNLPPAITDVVFKVPSPAQPALITAAIADADGINQAVLLYRTAGPGRETAEVAVPMLRVSGSAQAGTYQVSLPGQPAATLVRFRVKAVDGAGSARFQPRATEPQPTYSYYVYDGANTASVPLGFIINVTRSRQAAPPPGRFARFSNNNVPVPTPCQPNAAFVYVPPGAHEAQTFDYVHIPRRSGGYKVHFARGHPQNGMTSINIIFEDSPRWILSEPLSYELYRLADVPAELTDHLRLTVDGRLQGYHLLIEQPNKSFLTRNQRDTTGNMYKLIWYGQDVVSKHEKKSNLETGHDDLIALINGLKRKPGPEQWEFIRTNFNIPECVNYYAVNMCIQNWDGFFNNYFTYHDTGGTGKWEIYPWDEDKTWGDFDNAPPNYDWYEMPLTFGMTGDRPPRLDPNSKANNTPGPFGGVSWWRADGYFSGPLLANPEFRRLFLVRLREVCNTHFTEEKFYPVIDAMEKRLEPEITVRARGDDPIRALQVFRHDMQSFRNQVMFRRKFILAELDKTR